MTSRAWVRAVAPPPYQTTTTTARLPCHDLTPVATGAEANAPQAAMADCIPDEGTPLFDYRAAKDRHAALAQAAQAAISAPSASAALRAAAQAHSPARTPASSHPPGDDSQHGSQASHVSVGAVVTSQSKIPCTRRACSQTFEVRAPYVRACVCVGGRVVGVAVVLALRPVVPRRAR